jgi:acetoin utilization deacetylase AcuC-like enzyme
VRVFHCDAYAVPLPPGHRFPMPKYGILRERLVEEGTLRPRELTASEPVAVDALLLAHDRAYVEAVVSGDVDEDAVRRLGFPWSEQLVNRSRASVYGTIAAARAALQDGVAGNLAGGTHHAFPNHGEGYCVFNDHSVAIRLLQLEGVVDRAAVVDLDVHQGNGTAAIFAGDESVFTFSMHGARNFPFRKQRSSLDVELRDECEDVEYLALLSRHLPEVLDAARADIIFYQAGVDPLAQDALGRLRLTHEGLRARDRIVLTAARDRGIPVVLTLGGGYAKPLDLSVEAHCGTYREANAVFE